jgi:methionyl-tRNA formyltransferase
MKERVVLAGNNAASVRVLDLLLEAVPAGAILAIAPPRGGAAGWQVSLADAAAARRVAFLEPLNINSDETIARVREHEPSLLLSVYYTQLFRDALLESIDGPILNFHPSLLPRHRGHAPIVWAVASGDAVTGLSVHHVDRGIDTGRLVYQLPLPIHPLDRGYDVHRKMEALVAATAADLIRRLAEGRGVPRGEEQTGEASSHSRRDPQLNHIDWHQGSERIRDIVRALAPPLPGAFVRHGDLEIVLVEVEHAPAPGPVRAPGMVDVDQRGRVFVWAADGPLRVVSALVDGRIVDGAFVRSLGVATGTLFR